MSSMLNSTGIPEDACDLGSGGLNIGQNVALCLILSALGGSLEVFSTAILAYPNAKAEAGEEQYSACGMRLFLVGNLVFQISASIVGNLIAPWFGPVSFVGPFFLSAQLLMNMVVFGSVLGLDCFTKDMKIGTYVAVIGCIMLIVVGPTTQECQNVEELLLERWYSIAWSIVLIVGMVGSALTFPMDITRFSVTVRFVILLIARSTSFTINLTVSKAMILSPPMGLLIASLVLKILSGAVMTLAIVIQSTAVAQSSFVPINASFIIIVNGITGIILWDDWKVVQSWLGYVCVIILLGLGCFLLLGEFELLTSDNSKFGRKIFLARITAKRDLFDVQIDRSEEEFTPSTHLNNNNNTTVGAGGPALTSNVNIGGSTSTLPSAHSLSLRGPPKTRKAQAIFRSMYQLNTVDFDMGRSVGGFPINFSHRVGAGSGAGAGAGGLAISYRGNNIIQSPHAVRRNVEVMQNFANTIAASVGDIEPHFDNVETGETAQPETPTTSTSGRPKTSKMLLNVPSDGSSPTPALPDISEDDDNQEEDVEENRDDNFDDEKEKRK